jgi:hypothetical protein
MATVRTTAGMPIFKLAYEHKYTNLRERALNEITIGVALMVGGAVIYLLAKTKRQRPTVSADRGSVAVGGNNKGPIRNINLNPSKDGQAGGSNHLAIAGFLIGLIGTGVTLWSFIYPLVK